MPTECFVCHGTHICRPTRSLQVSAWFGICTTHSHIHTLTPHTYICQGIYMYVHINMFNSWPYLPTQICRAVHRSNTKYKHELETLGHPCVHPHALYRRALSVLSVWGSAKHNWRMEVTPRILTVTAIIGATRAAQTVHRGASHFLPGLGLGLWWLW